MAGSPLLLKALKDTDMKTLQFQNGQEINEYSYINKTLEKDAKQL